MKTNKFWLVTTAAVVLTIALATVSCSKNEEDSSLVYESQVTEQGLSPQVTEQSGTEGTQLSYESWIVVKGQTRAAFENKVSVMLNNTLNHVTKEIEVDTWESVISDFHIDYEEEGRHPNGDYVTVIDSVARYCAVYSNFSIEYKLGYQVAVYDDGVTEQVMPYHKYGAIIDNGCVLTPLDDVQENGITYKRQQCTHSITVELNGKEYTVSAVVILRKAAIGDDVLLSSSVVDEGVSFAATGEWSGELTSWIVVKQLWSESGNRELKKEIVLKNNRIDILGYLINGFDNRRDPADFAWAQNKIAEEITQTRKEQEITVQTYQYDMEVYLDDKKQDERLFYLPYKFTYEKAIYQDDQISYEMPGWTYTDPQTFFDIGNWYQVENGKWLLSYQLNFSIKFGDQTYKEVRDDLFYAHN